MSQYHLEQEEIEKIKNWWKKYGSSTISGVVIGLIIMFGWQYWTQYRIDNANQASAIYDRMMLQYSVHNINETKVEAQTLKDKYPSTAYADFAALMLANIAVTNNDLTLAKENLEWANRHAKPAVFKEIARLRLARVLAALNQPEDALRLLSKNEDETFAPVTNEIRGDILVESHNYTEAKQAYEFALKNDSAPLVAHPFLQMKLDNIME